MVNLDAKVAFLRKQTSYPEGTGHVQALETHMSWVFLTDRYAYKLKKPVLFTFLDFSTPERRRHYCDEEVRLNRRLAPRVYIGTVPLTADAHGQLTLGGPGSAVDWLVKMHRLPPEGMLDYAIRKGTFTREQIEELAHVLSAFYAEAAPANITGESYIDRLEADIAENRRELAAVGSILHSSAVQRVHNAQLDFIREQERLLGRRVRDGRVIEGHGDLRPEHVALAPETQIIDRLEFNQAFRTLDPLDELAYFALECEMLDAGAVGTIVLERYRLEAADAAPLVLVDFYKCYRACLRAKLSIWHLREPNARDEHWRKRARAYFTAASVYADRVAAAQLSVSATSESPA